MFIKKNRNYLLSRLKLFSLIDLTFLLFSLYYLIIYGIIFKYTQKVIFYNTLFGVIYNFMFGLLLSFCISVSRKLTLKLNWKYLYNISFFLWRIYLFKFNCIPFFILLIVFKL